MSFGKRTGAIPAGPAMSGVASRPPGPIGVSAPPEGGTGGVVGFVLGHVFALMTVAVSLLVLTTALALVPAVNPTGTPLLDVFSLVSRTALPSALGFGAVIFLLVDLVMKLAKCRKAWLYALLCATPAVLWMVMLGVMSNGKGTMMYLALCAHVAPGALGGFVLGRYRQNG